MDTRQKVVTQMPLTELWSGSGPLDAFRVEKLGEPDIVRLLENGSSFVVAEVGQPLWWIAEGDRFAFWKAEVKCRLVVADADIFQLEDYPGSYCYVASMWKGVSSKPIIVLEKHH